MSSSSFNEPNFQPRDPESGSPLPPKAQPGYYPGYQVLQERDAWDKTTRQVVLQRLQPPPEITCFNEHEIALLEVVCEHLLPQGDRNVFHRIPIVPLLAQRVSSGKIPGYRYAEMPPDLVVYQKFLRALEATATEAYRSSGFLALNWLQQEELLKSVHEGRPMGAPAGWAGLPARRAFDLVLHDCLEAYYSHPWSWDEIGFGGPAYPRAYFRLEGGEPEPWEVREKRYEWKAPGNTISDQPA